MNTNLSGLLGCTCRNLTTGNDYTVIGWEVVGDVLGLWCLNKLGIALVIDLTDKLEFRNVRTNPDE